MRDGRWRGRGGRGRIGNEKGGGILPPQSFLKVGAYGTVCAALVLVQQHCSPALIARHD